MHETPHVQPYFLPIDNQSVNATILALIQR